MSYANFIPGWIAPSERTPEQHKAHEAALASMPEFKIVGAAEAAPDKVVLTDFWKQDMTVAALGYKFPRIHQLTGSCVGAGGGNASFSLISIEVLRLGDPELIFVPFWLYPYGKSRQLAGMRGRGEGSMGSTFAQAVVKYGMPSATMAGMPKFTNSDGLVWSESLEYQWSDGAAAPDSVAQEGAKHLIKSAAQLNSVDDIVAAIRNYYPVTWACSRYIGRPRVSGRTNPTVVGTLDSSGGHQTSLQGVWEHPELGLLIKNQNNWPASAYPTDPDESATECAAWQPADDLAKYLRSGDAECYALSQYDGYPAQSLDKLLFKIAGN